MKVAEEFDGGIERQILIGMIVNKTVLSAIAAKWSHNALVARYSNIIAGWCIEHYQKHGRPPRRGIVNYFQDWKVRVKDNESAELIEKLLASLSYNYQSEGLPSPTHLIDLAGNYLNKVRIQNLIDSLQGSLEVNDLTRAETAISSFTKVEMGSGSYVEFFNDREAVFSTFSYETDDSLFDYPGDLGVFFMHMLKRKKLLAFQGAEKSGKSYCLIDMAYRAMLARNRVAFFAVGDMSEEEMKERLGVRTAQHPSRSETGKWPYMVKIPTSIALQGEDPPKIIYTERVFEKPLDGTIAWAACERTMKKLVKSTKSFFRLQCHPNDSVSILDIRNTLLGWAGRDWCADVVIIDYADILSPIPGIKEPRDQSNATWKKMKALSQELHCLVVTATQADAASYEKRIQDKRNFSEDKRKNAHANGICGINVTGPERDLGVSRYNWIVNRERKANHAKCIYLAGSLDIGCPSMVSVSGSNALATC